MPSGQYAFLDNRNLIALFDRWYEQAKGLNWSMQIGTHVDSDREIEDLGFLGAAPQLELLTGDAAKEEQFNKYQYALKNMPYSKTLKIKEQDLRRDRQGLLETRIQEFTQNAVNHWDILAASAIAANPLGYDGVALFSTAHPTTTGNTQSNLITSAATGDPLDVVNPAAPTAVEAAAAISYVIGNFFTMIDDKGNWMNGTASDFTILIGTTSLWTGFQYALSAVTFGAGQSNQLLGVTAGGIKLKLQFVPGLASATNSFFVFRNDAPLKALILQDEVPVNPAVSTRDNDEFIKFRRFLFNLYCSRAVGVGRYQSAIKATFS